jgi:predicted exporter
VDYGTKNLGPREDEAMTALEEVQREIGGYDDALWLIVSGDDEREVSESLEASGKMLDEGVKEGLLSGYTLPNAVWPRPDNQQGNREIARRLASRLPAARDAALEMGFTEESLQLTEEVFAALERFAATDGVVWPTNAGSQWVLRQFVGSDSGRQLTLGRLEASSTATPGDLLQLSDRLISVTGAQLIGWSLLSESLMEIMKRDISRVLIPMGAVLLLLLGIAFRKPGGVALSLVTLGFSFLCLLGLMALMGWSWNLMNVMALPLLFGAGVDYSIHIQFALQRNNGDRSRVFQAVGRAILLCGVSTAAGFGSLGFATNAGLASLGRVCSAGIVITSLVSVFLLPVWWRTMGKCFQGKYEEEVS